MTARKNGDMTEEKKQPVKIKTVRADTYRQYYASNVRLTVSFFDIKLTCGEMFQDEAGNRNFREDVTVVFSPQHAKLFLSILQNRIKEYEQKNGIIPEAGEGTAILSDSSEK